jgi:hypothetical protein
MGIFSAKALDNQQRSIQGRPKTDKNGSSCFINRNDKNCQCLILAPMISTTKKI